MINKPLEDALAPNFSGKDDVKNNVAQSTDRDEPPKHDSVESESDGETFLVDSGTYTAILLDGSECVLKLDTNSYVAVFEGEEYELEINGLTYTLTNKDRVLDFVLVTEKTAYFKQIEK